MMGRRLGLFTLGWVLVLFGGLIACLVQTSGGVSVRDIRYPGTGGSSFSALLYVPPGASAAHPAPAVLVSHGFINTREMQSPFAIELARRGFVVLAMDMAGHGWSDGALGEQGFGGPAGLAYLKSLPFVDKTEIGLEGHSMGGSPVMAAAASDPTGYRSVVLEGSTTHFLGAGPEGSPAFPRNLEVVFGQHDEFAETMWQVAKGSEVGSSKRLEAIFGVNAPVVPGRLYGDLAAGTGRRLVNPAVDHPQEHFSNAGVGAAVDWFQKTLTGEASPKPPSHQVWLGKEVGTLLGFVGAVVLMLGTFHLLLETRLFAALRTDGKASAGRRSGRWWLGFAVTTALPAVTFYPLMKIAPAVFMGPFALAGALPFALAAFPEQITDQLAVWAVLTGLIGFALSFLTRSGKPVFAHRWLQTLGAAVISVGMAHLALWVTNALFHVDFRFWVLGLKLLDGRHFGLFLTYLPFFAVFFLLALRGFSAGLPVRGESGAAALIVGAAAMSLGFAAMLAAQYACMAATGLLLTPDEPLNTIIAFQFVPLLAMIGIIAAFTWRRTGDYLPGALICALFVTWYIVAGTAIFPAKLGLAARAPAAAAAAK